MTRDERNIYNYWLTRRNINNIIEKRCSVCQEWKEENLDNFYYKNKSKPELGLTSACRICTRPKANKYRADHADDNIRRCHDYYHTNKEEDNENHQKIAINREINRAYQMEYHRGWLKRPENKGKIKMYGDKKKHHDISNQEWYKCLEVFNSSCAYCGITSKESKKKYKQILHREHVDNEGYNDLRNAVPACKICNSYKHKYKMEEWYRQQEFFSEDKLQFINWWIAEGFKDYIEEKPPYKVIKKKDTDTGKFYHELWSMDEKRNPINLIAIKTKKKDLEEDIKEYLDYITDK